jgi:YD repeat-containing protein
VTRKRIILAIVLLALLQAAALAQSRTFYDSSGRVSGRSTTDSGGATTFYGADGRVTGRASTHGNTTTTYGADGRRTGTVTAPKREGR